MRIFNLIKHYILTLKRNFSSSFSLKADKRGNTMLIIPIILGLISGTVVLTSETTEGLLAETRDVRRSADVYQISNALAFYYDDNGQYPVASGQNSWDVLEQELEPDYVQELPQDPKLDSGFEYRYESNGKKAIVYYYSEAEDIEHERWSY